MFELRYSKHQHEYTIIINFSQNGHINKDKIQTPVNFAQSYSRLVSQSQRFTHRYGLATSIYLCSEAAGLAL